MNETVEIIEDISNQRSLAEWLYNRSDSRFSY